MKTVTICPNGGQPQLEMSRNDFERIAGNPSKEAIRNWEKILRRYFEDYREETPSTQYHLTPYQQWILLIIHEEFKGWKNRHTRLPEIKTWIQSNKEKLRKEIYENQ